MPDTWIDRKKLHCNMSRKLYFHKIFSYFFHFGIFSFFRFDCYSLFFLTSFPRFLVSLVLYFSYFEFFYFFTCFFLLCFSLFSIIWLFSFFSFFLYHFPQPSLRDSNDIRANFVKKDVLSWAQLFIIRFGRISHLAPEKYLSTLET